MTVDTTARTLSVEHGLLKQRSRRLLGNVIRRKMVTDNMDGYNDELQYNIARRSPTNNGTEEDFAHALENLKAIQQKILRAHSHITKPRTTLISPVVFTSLKPNFVKDNNANFISTAASSIESSSKRTKKNGVSVPSKPDGDCSKTSARSAISNALFQSMNFKQFKQNSDDKTTGNVKPVKHVNAIPSKSRVHIIAAPITTIKAAGKLAGQNGHAKLPTIGMAEKPHDIGSHTQVTAKAGKSITTFHTVKKSKPSLAQGDQIEHGTGVSMAVVKRPDASRRNGSLASQFRIKSISISGHPQESVSDTSRSRSYVSGISLYKQSSPGTLTVSLNSIQSQEGNQNNTSQNVSKTSSGGNSIGTNGSTSNSEKRITSRKSHIISAAADVKKLNRMESATVNAARKPILKTETLSDSRLSPASKPKLDSERKTSPMKDNGKMESPRKEIPRFYFPKGKPRPKTEMEDTLKRISDVCSLFKDKMVPLEDMGLLAKACNVSMYWKGPLFHAAVGKSRATRVSENDIKLLWKRIASLNNDPSSRFVSLLAKPGKDCLDFEDFLPLLKDIVESHPGLIFLKDAPEFHTRYMNTVIARIFYAVNRSWSGQITASELRKSNFLTVLSLLEEEDDINAITDYFSYEHFYVIYCKFWELDSDHDLVIDEHDLIGYGDGVLSSRLIARVLSGAVTRWDTSDHHLSKMSYVDFVWFILSEEDKKTQTSIEYWFRCMDLDGDGYISMYEMEYFYEEQSQKLEQLDIEPLPFEDCVCQVFDIVNPRSPGKVSLRDLKKSKMAHVFFDTFFNVAKYLNNEQKDPFVGTDGVVAVTSDWDIFAAEEYELLVAEEHSSKLSDVSNSILEEERVDMLDEREPTTSYSSATKSIPLHSRDGDNSKESNTVIFHEANNKETLAPLGKA